MRPCMPFPFSEAGLRYTFSGTAAVYQGVKAYVCNLGDKGAPCPTIVATKLNLCSQRLPGIAISGSANLEIDLEDIQTRLTPMSKPVGHHYFGFAQTELTELKALCQSNGTLLVGTVHTPCSSDNASHTLGRTGDIAIFSFRKTLPLPHGGLLINNPSFTLNRPL